MSLFLKNDEILDPVQIRLDSAFTVAAHRHKVGYGIQKWGGLMRSERHSTNPFVNLIAATLPS